MKDEIKEILDYLKDEDEYYKKAEEVIVGYGDLIIEKEDVDKVLDYITNLQQENKNQAKRNSRQRLANQKQYELILKLQQENERLKIKTKEQSLLLIDYQDMEQRYEDYKSRCEKAIEYLKSYNTDFEHCRFNEAPISLRELGDLLNILQNGSEEK
jgi:hypothetical protein